MISQYARNLGPLTAAKRAEHTFPLTDDVMAGLVRMYRRMAPARQREFWQLTGSALTKAAFLLRWGSFEIYTKE